MSTANKVGSGSAVAAIKKTILVNASPALAFQIFTEGHGSWWPVQTHHIGKVPAQTAILEPRVGGRWYELGEDGSECEWGKVLIWEPPHRLVLAWQIAADWKFDPNLVAEVEVRFVQEGSKTRVELEHRKLEVFGSAAAKVRAELDGGWLGILERFAGTIEQREGNR